MSLQDLRKVLETSTNKLSVFADKNKINSYHLNNSELLHAIKEFLTDEEIASLFKMNHFKNSISYLKKSIIKIISDDNIKMDLLMNGDFLLDLYENEIIDIISTLSSSCKLQILENNDLLQKYNLKYNIGEVIKSLEDEELQIQTIDKYKIDKYIVVNIIKTFSDKKKKEVILENKYNFNEGEIISLLKSMSTKNIIEFININNNFLEKNSVKIYNIIKYLNTEKQLDVIANFEDISLDMRREKTNFSSFKK